MTPHTQEMQNAVCVKVPYLVCSTGVLSFHTLKLVFCIICKPRSHTTFHSPWVHDVTAPPPVQQRRTIKPENRSSNQRSPPQNQRPQFRLGSVQQTQPRNPKKKQKWFPDHSSTLIVRHHHTRKDRMTSFTHEPQNAVCVKVPYLVCSTGVLSFRTLKLMFCIICKPRSHTTFYSSWVYDIIVSFLV